MNSYTFSKSHNTTCKYMRLLKALLDTPDGLTKAEAYAIAYKKNPMLSRGWGSNTWAAFSKRGLAKPIRTGNKTVWHITDAGKSFYYRSLITKDLLAA